MFRGKVLRPKLIRIYNDASNETSVLRNQTLYSPTNAHVEFIKTN